MEQRNDEARELMEGVVLDLEENQPYTRMQAKLEGFFSEWHAEAEKIHQNDKYFTLDAFTSELWVTTKQFEDDLRANHNRYE